jgi:hypothetical protein
MEYTLAKLIEAREESHCDVIDNDHTGQSSQVAILYEDDDQPAYGSPLDDWRNRRGF